MSWKKKKMKKKCHLRILSYLYHIIVCATGLSHTLRRWVSRNMSIPPKLTAGFYFSFVSLYIYIGEVQVDGQLLLHLASCYVFSYSTIYRRLFSNCRFLFSSNLQQLHVRRPLPSGNLFSRGAAAPPHPGRGRKGGGKGWRCSRRRD